MLRNLMLTFALSAVLTACGSSMELESTAVVTHQGQKLVITVRETMDGVTNILINDDLALSRKPEGSPDKDCVLENRNTAVCTFVGNYRGRELLVKKIVKGSMMTSSTNFEIYWDKELLEVVNLINSRSLY